MSIAVRSVLGSRNFGLAYMASTIIRSGINNLEMLVNHGYLTLMDSVHISRIFHLLVCAGSRQGRSREEMGGGVSATPPESDCLVGLLQSI